MYQMYWPHLNMHQPMADWKWRVLLVDWDLLFVWHFFVSSDLKHRSNRVKVTVIQKVTCTDSSLWFPLPSFTLLRNGSLWISYVSATCLYSKGFPLKPGALWLKYRMSASSTVGAYPPCDWNGLLVTWALHLEVEWKVCVVWAACLSSLGTETRQF